MTTESQIELTHYQRINHVKQHIRDHVDEPLNREVLADIAGFSVSHFHRIFTAHVGESIARYVRRVRMERAAKQLLDHSIHVTDVALESGYETHAAFGKAFKQTFGFSPSEFRELNSTAAAYTISRRIPYNHKEFLMEPKEITTLPDMQVLYARASEVMNGPAFTTAPQEAFDKLMGYLMSNNLGPQIRHIIALYPDEPEVGKEIRIDAGAIFADGTVPEATDGLAYQTLASGKWAVFRHAGPYDNLWQTWQGIYRDWLPTSGEEPRHALCFEDYINSPDEVAPEELLTDIYVPLK